MQNAKYSGKHIPYPIAFASPSLFPSIYLLGTHVRLTRFWIVQKVHKIASIFTGPAKSAYKISLVHGIHRAVVKTVFLCHSMNSASSVT